MKRAREWKNGSPVGFDVMVNMEIVSVLYCVRKEGIVMVRL